MPCRKAMKLPLALQLAFLSLITTNALFADEPLAISSVLKVPGDYHLQVVTLEGSIQDMEPVQQYRSMGRECASVRFRLEDKTGSIQVLVPGPCGNPGLAAPFIPGFVNGDGVRIEARIEAPGSTQGRGCPLSQPAIPRVVLMFHRHGHTGLSVHHSHSRRAKLKAFFSVASSG